MSKFKKKAAPLFKVRSKINSDVYYSSQDFPSRIIDGKTFMGVKKTPSDSVLHYMLKENMVKVLGEE